MNPDGHGMPMFTPRNIPMLRPPLQGQGATPSPPADVLSPAPQQAQPPVEQPFPDGSMRAAEPDEQGGLGGQINKFLEKERGLPPGEAGGPRTITLNFKDVPIADAVTALSKQAGINITLDKDVPADLTVTSVYSGTSIDNALKSITSGMDLRHKKTPDGFLITPWEERYIDVNKVYLYGSSPSSTPGGPAPSPTSGAFPFLPPQQTGQIVGPGIQSPSSSGGAASAQTVNISDFGGYMDSLVSMIRPLLSRQGVVSYMPTGFIYVKDYPSRVKAVEEMLNIDNDKREEVYIKITILRIDYKKEYESGINWSKVFEGFKVGSPIAYNIGTDFLSTLKDQKDNVFSFGYKDTLNNLNLAIKALGRYGNVKIVHSWETRAITGSVIPFDLTQLVWYSYGSIVQVVNNQTITSPQISNTQVGLSITLNPTRHGDDYLLNTAVRMSNVVSSQTIGDLTFPVIEDNKVSVPIKMKAGEQIAISGFKIRRAEKTSVGIPILSSIPILEYLFGYRSSQNSTSEIAVVISLNERKGQQL